MNRQLGSIQLSEKYLAEESVGHWVIENDPGEEPRMYVDDVMLGLIGLEEQTDPETTFKAWLAGIDENFMDSVLETERLNVKGIKAEVQYPWHYPDGHTILVRCEGIRNYAYTKGIRTEGRHRNITDLIRLQKENAVIAALSGDFECVDYVMLHSGYEDDVLISFRASEKIKQQVPGWEQERSFHDRLESLIRNVGYKDDILEFRALTRRDVILKHLEEEPAYFVNARAVVDDGSIEYFQLKFMADRDQSGKLIGIVAGIHNIDHEMRQELELRKKIAKLVDEKTAELNSKNKALSKVNYRIIEAVGNIVESRDPESGDHINRVKYLTRILAMQVMKDLPEYELTVDDVTDIVNMSPLHDVGKIRIPDRILLKPGRLDNAEFEIMKTHCEKGCEIIEGMAEDWNPKLTKLSLDICRYHHEKWDGRGYPEGLKGDEIPIAAQIVSIADIYDALVSERCYKKAFSHEEACCMITSGDCGAFSDKLLYCFGKVEEAFKDCAIYAAASEDEKDESTSLLEGAYVSDAVSFLEKISDAMPGGFFIYQADDEEKFIYFNDLMVKYLGCSSREEFIEYTGNSFKGLVYPDDYEEISNEIDQQIQLDNLDHIIYRIRQKNGTIRWLDDYGRFVHSEDMGDIFFVFVVDFTERYLRNDAAYIEEKYEKPTFADHDKAVLQGLNILVVDDSDDARELNRELLEEEGAVVTEAANGHRAVTLVRENMDYDLILMDLVMPIMSGADAIREIKGMLRETEKDITIVCLTAEGSDVQIREALDAGAYGCMSKPLNISELAGYVHAAAKQKTEHQES